MATATFAADPQSSALAMLALGVASTVTLAANPTSAAVAEVSLTGATVTLQALPFSSTGAALALTGSTLTFSAGPISSASAVVSLTGSTVTFGANPISSASSSLTLCGATAQFSANPLSAIDASVSLTGANDEHGMSLCDLVDEMLALCGVFCRHEAPDFMLERAIRDVNTALQLVWNNAQGRTYWTNSTLTITLTDGQYSYNLPDNVQNVTGPCRLESTKRTLATIGTLAELETFADLYLDGGTAAQPLAYHIERIAQSGTDPAKCILRVTPPVSGASLGLMLEVVNEAPRFTMGDLQSCPLVPIPHTYVESLLLPIARYEICTFYLFRKDELKKSIDANYNRAMVLLGLADPLPGNSGDNEDKREEGKTK